MNDNFVTYNDEKVSVIIPTFNRAGYIEAAIESILEQTHPVFEIIVVDDGSTDNTKEILKKYGSIVKYVFQENNGPASARNRGLRMAQGNYIAFLDSDDLWVPYKNTVQLRFFSEHPDIDLVFGHMANFSSEETSLEPEILNIKVYNYFKEKYTNPDRALDYLIIENIIPTPTVMFKSKCLTNSGFFNENLRCAEDYDYWLRFAYYYRLGFIDRILIKRRLHGENIIDDYLLRVSSHLDVLERFSYTYPHLPRSTKCKLEKAVSQKYYQLGSYYFKLRDLENSFRFLKQAFPHYLLNCKYDVKIAWSFLFRKKRCS